MLGDRGRQRSPSPLPARGADPAARSRTWLTAFTGRGTGRYTTAGLEEESPGRISLLTARREVGRSRGGRGAGANAICAEWVHCVLEKAPGGSSRLGLNGAVRSESLSRRI